MSISPVCAAPSSRIAPKVINGLTNGFISLVILFTTASIASAATLVVPAGGDLQAAINSAAPGDTIVLEAGATYRGPFWLPKKTGDAYVTIQSSRASEITGRVTPAQSGLLAKLRSTGGEALITTLPGAHHYKLIGLDISTFSAGDLIYTLVALGDDAQTDVANVPHHLILDRLWVHGFPTQPVQRGISLNSAETSIVNSYISDIHMAGFDTQAICGWNGPGPFQIINNYLEAAGENVMFGGALPAIRGLIPSNIEIRRNHFFKPLSWKVGHPSYAGIHWSIKNLLELKNARNVIIDGNILENSWTDAQIGYGVLFTVRSENGLAPWATIENVTFTNNTMKNTDQGLQLLGADLPYPSGRGNGLTIANNLFIGIADRFLTMSGFYNVTLNHNTHFQNGNVTALYNEPSLGFVYTNNITVRTGYGFFGDSGGEGNGVLATYTPGFVFQRNLIAGAAASIYPVNNFYPSSITGVLDSEFRVVNSAYKAAGTDGKDLGCDITALNAAQSGSAPSPTPTPTPTPVPSPTPVPTGVIQFSSSSYSVNETAGAITITVTRTGSTAASATVQFSSADATAMSSGDYATVAGTLTFAAGESSRSFTIFITDDVTKEGTEAFNVRLSNPSNASLGTPALATVNIVDNDKRPRGPRASTEFLKSPRKKAVLIISDLE